MAYSSSYCAERSPRAANIYRVEESASLHFIQVPIKIARRRKLEQMRLIFRIQTNSLLFLKKLDPFAELDRLFRLGTENK